jgi:hypothetical protein
LVQGVAACRGVFCAPVKVRVCKHSSLSIRAGPAVRVLSSTLNFQLYDRSRRAELRPLPKSPFEGRAATSLGFAQVPPCITDADARAVLVWTKAHEDAPGSQGMTASSSVGKVQISQRNLQFSKEAMVRTSSFRRISHRSHCHGYDLARVLKDCDWCCSRHA